jgi:hypothetical protein
MRQDRCARLRWAPRAIWRMEAASGLTERIPVKVIQRRHGRACPGHLDRQGTAVPRQSGCAGQARA